MIVVHRLRGEEMFLNADLIESIERTPDTVVTLIDGRRIVVSDDPDDIARRVVAYRGAILASAEDLRAGGRPPLVAIEGGEE
ncbi:MAG TPA: endoflagellar protein [Actinobacteria bacterium]|nr:endoflagellar protein [Actinomycetota bacterium]